MSDLIAKCDWYDSTLSIVLPEDPERIVVRMFDSKLAPARLYVPEAETLALKDENVKLRELVQSLYKFSFEEYPDGTELNLADELRKLGIEIEEDE